ncbi:Tlg2-vesicle protein [Blastocladiella emersonii ATCC 22665]|nr:Tlg2-vesicle protein [Blastocladiella emersonii ATCC 22665]
MGTLSSTLSLGDGEPPAWSRYPRATVFVAVVAGLAGLFVLAAFYSQILAALDEFAHFARGSPVVGSLLCIMLIVASSFPPIMGYSTTLYLCGYIFGFPNGFPPAFVGAMLGACSCFYASRHFLRHHAHRAMRRYPMARALRHTIEKRGLKLILLIRLAPYPFNFTNALLATTHLPLRTFALATALTLPKTLLHIYIGASISSFAGGTGHDGSPAQQQHPAKTAFLVVSVLVGIGLTVWLYRHVQAIVRRDNPELELDGLGGSDGGAAGPGYRRVASAGDMSEAWLPATIGTGVPDVGTNAVSSSLPEVRSAAGSPTLPGLIKRPSHGP